MSDWFDNYKKKQIKRNVVIPKAEFLELSKNLAKKWENILEFDVNQAEITHFEFNILCKYFDCNSFGAKTTQTLHNKRF